MNEGKDRSFQDKISINLILHILINWWLDKNKDAYSNLLFLFLYLIWHNSYSTEYSQLIKDSSEATIIK